MTTTSTGSTTEPSLTTPVSIASTTSAGAAGGSVINVSGLVSELVAAAEAPQQSEITNQTTAVTANISALGTLKSALSTFQSSLSSLSTPTAFNNLAASTSQPTSFTASAAPGAVAGNYGVTISNIATGQELLSSAFAAGSSSPIGTGTLAISVGGNSFNVTVDSTNDTLAGLANAINTQSGNTGVSAAVIQGTDGAYLLLSSTQTGLANTISVSETDGGNALAALTYGTGNTANYTQQSAAADASFSIAGVAYTSPSNTVSNALSGVTLELLAPTTPATGSSSGTGTGTGSGTGTASDATLTVANSTSTVASNIQTFVTAYNTLQSALSGLGSYDSTTGTAGPMLGNPVLTGTQNQIQQALYSLVGASTYNSLASIGITTNSDGSLSLNSAQLQTALSSNFGAVSQLFSATNGVATQLNTQITSDLSSTGTIGTYAQTLTSQENALTTQTNNLNTQMEALTASMTQQYAALNTLLSSLQTTSSYLTQAFASLPQVQGKSSA
jgi:flagellar hook-associated protein 2